ncbi:MAG: ComEC/Rec2 family competence protein, partial [Flavobacteriales bacterium]|nr:ComEC/Rec2 family competence protein [Flavobacteriales bacterium]
LHVGIIYLILTKLLQFMLGRTNRYYVYGIILLVTLWFYAAITGFSASICRATTMFSLVIIGDNLNRQVNIYNSILASAFILLLTDPFWIFDVGFQLSYIAVLGIVTFQPSIEKWLSFKNTVLKYMWSISAVSIAAQISTFPLSVFYFHQFPIYFLLSNLIVIPIVGVVLILCLFFLSTYYIPLIGITISNVLLVLVKGLNQYVAWVNVIPGATIENISITINQCILMYAMLICFYIYFVTRRSDCLIIGLVTLLFALGSAL